MTTTNFVATKDDTVIRTSANSTWTSLVNGNGTSLGGDAYVWDWIVEHESGTTTDRWDRVHRSIFIFDTSSLPDGDVITAATLKIGGHSKTDPATAIALDINVYGIGASGTDAQLLLADYQLVGATAFSTAITYANWDIVAGINNQFTLNASGRANISKTGSTRFCLRSENYDADDVAPTWSSNTRHSLDAEMTDNPSDKPTLEVIHEAAPAGSFFPRMIIV